MQKVFFLLITISQTVIIFLNQKNDNVQSYSGVVKREELKSPSKEFISRDDYRVPRHVEEYDSASSSSSVSIPERKREDSKGKDIPKQAITSESVKTKEEDDELMVMFDKSTNFTQSDVSLNQHQTVPLLEPIPPKPIITITKTTENGVLIVVFMIFMLKCLIIFCFQFRYFCSSHFVEVSRKVKTCSSRFILCFYVK